MPERLDDYLYYTRTEAGRQYPIYCRKLGSLEAGEEIAPGSEFPGGRPRVLPGRRLEASPDHRFLAYSVDTSGGEEFTSTSRT